jgi:hyperosmotically inducible protein
MKGNGLTRSRLWAGLAASVLLSVALPASADDAAIQKRVEARLQNEKLLTAGDVQVSVSSGVVTLNGAVTTVAAQRSAVKAARKEAKAVESHLRVVPEERPDVDIGKSVRSAILRYPWYNVFESVEYSVDSGVVVLQGSVQQPWRKKDLDSLVAAIPGVREVRDEISVQSLSPFDDRLRRQIYRGIYGNTSAVMGRYVGDPDPPVRIVVDNGRVTLTGYVSSPVEQAQVGNVARQTLAFAVDNRVKVDGGPPASDRKPEKAGSSGSSES